MPLDEHRPEKHEQISVRKVARLARLEVAPADIDALSDALGSILDHVRVLEELDLAGVEPLSHASDMEAELAEDTTSGELPHEALEAIAPSVDDRFIVVPKVLGGGSGGA